MEKRSSFMKLIRSQQSINKAAAAASSSSEGNETGPQNFRRLMEMIAPRLHENAALVYVGKMNNLAVSCKTQIQLPLHRPKYIQPLRIKPPNKKPNRKPVATISDILRLMDGLKLPVPVDIYTSLIKECTESGDASNAIELQEHIARSGISLSLPLVNRILLMNIACGCLEHARQLFDEMSKRDFNSWAILIAACVERGKHDEAIKLYIKMLHDDEFHNTDADQMKFSVPGIVTCVLRACESTTDFELGKQVHCWLWKMGFSKNAALISFLISFYGKLKHYKDAQNIFDQVLVPDTAMWTSRIVNCCNDDNFEGVVDVFREMGKEGVRKNEYTFSTVLKACRRTGAIMYGRQVHANALKLGLESDGFVQCGLVDLYGKCGFVGDAAKVFEIGRSRRNEACYNAMFANYMQHGLFVEAIKTLYEMKIAGFKPRKSMFDEVRLACGSRICG